MAIKQKIYTHYQQLIASNIEAIHSRQQSLNESITNETKSSAGDKYETSRAMIHIEQEQVGQQLQEALEQKATLDALDITIHSTHIIKGSLVKTNKGYLFISTGLSKTL